MSWLLITKQCGCRHSFGEVPEYAMDEMQVDNGPIYDSKTGIKIGEKDETLDFRLERERLYCDEHKPK